MSIIKINIRGKMENDRFFILMYHGHIDNTRGIEKIIDVLQLNDELYAALMGNVDSEYRKQLEDRARNLNVFDRVCFLPAVPADRIWEYAGAVDVGMILAPATCENHYLSLPNKFFENVQSETPIICPHYPAMKALIEQYGIGLLCDPTNVNSIMKQVQILKGNSLLYEKLKKNVLDAKENLCWENEKQVLKDALLSTYGYEKYDVVKVLFSSIDGASRDKRELSVMHELGWRIAVASSHNDSKLTFEHSYYKLNGIELNLSQNCVLRKIYIVVNELRYLKQLRKIKADIFSCHDLVALRRVWFAFLFRKRPRLIYDAHEYEAGRYNKKKSVLRKKAILILEKYLIKKCDLVIMVNNEIANKVYHEYHLEKRPLVIRSTPEKYIVNKELCKKRRLEMIQLFQEKRERMS